MDQVGYEHLCDWRASLSEDFAVCNGFWKLFLTGAVKYKRKETHRASLPSQGLPPLPPLPPRDRIGQDPDDYGQDWDGLHSPFTQFDLQSPSPFTHFYLYTHLGFFPSLPLPFPIFPHIFGQTDRQTFAWFAQCSNHFVILLVGSYLSAVIHVMLIKMMMVLRNHSG